MKKVLSLLYLFFLECVTVWHIGYDSKKADNCVTTIVVVALEMVVVE